MELENHSESPPPADVSVSQQSIKNIKFDQIPLTAEDRLKAETGAEATAWNLTRSCVEMQSHALWHRNGQACSGFSVDDVLQGTRTGFSDPGPIETASVQFLKAAVAGDVVTITRMLREGLVNVDVADSRGQTALLGAAVTPIYNSEHHNHHRFNVRFLMLG